MKPSKDLLKIAKSTQQKNKQTLLALELIPKIDTFDIRTYEVLDQKECRKILSKIYDVTLEETTNAFRICILPDKTNNTHYCKIFISPDYLKEHIHSYDDLKSFMKNLQENLGFDDYIFTRLDLALDCPQPNMYDLAHKANHALLRCLSVENCLKNAYDTRGLDGSKRSLAVKCKGYEVEIYNKNIENGEPVSIRAEFRIKGKFGIDTIEDLLGRQWKKRIKQCCKDFKKISLQENDRLVNLYFDTINNNQNLHWRSDWKSFIHENELYIRTRVQLYDLVSRLFTDPRQNWQKGSTDVISIKNRVDKFLSRNTFIMFFSKSFISDYSNQMIDAIIRFLSKKQSVIDEEKCDNLSYFCDYEIDMMETLGINADGLLKRFNGKCSYAFPDGHIDHEEDLYEYIELRDRICKTIIFKYINLHDDDPCNLAEYDVLWGIKQKIDKIYEYLKIPNWPDDYDIYPFSQNVLLLVR